MRFLRFFGSTPFALLVTASLFILMIYLIRQPDVVEDVAESEEKIVLVEKKPPPPKKTEPDEATKNKGKLPDQPTVTISDPSPLDPPTLEQKPDGLPTGPTGGGEFALPSPIGIALITVAPVYPMNCQASGIEGTATVQFDILGSGDVVNATVIESSHRCFEKAALQAIEGWKYQPVPGREGEVVLAGVLKVFTFTLVE